MTHDEINVLVVGGAGYLGGAVTDILLERKIKFTVYDNLTYETRYLKNVPFIRGDVTDHDWLGKVLDKQKFTHVVWLAGIVGDAACDIDPTYTTKVNTEAVEWLRDHFKGKIIFTSTCSVYGRQDKMGLEDGETNPLTLYARTKLRAEMALMERDGDFELEHDATIFRLGTLFGIGDRFSRPRFDIVINTMTRDAVANGTIKLNVGSQNRPFIHVRDVAKVISDTIWWHGETRGIYNLSAWNLTIKDIAEIVSRITGAPIRYTGDSRDERDYLVDTSKVIHSGLFPHEPIMVQDGVREIMELIGNGRIVEPTDDTYTNGKAIRRYYDKMDKLAKIGT